MRSSSLESRWDRLARGAPPFLRPEFVLATARWTAPAGRPVFASIERGGDLVAMLPLVVRRGRLVALRGLHAPRYDLLGDPAALPALWQRVRDEISWHTMELRGVPEGSPLASELDRLARRDGFAVERAPGSEAPYLPLDSLEELSPGHARRHLTFERVTAADPLALEDLYRIEAAAWTGEARPEVSLALAERCFYTELARRFARRGRLSLSFLRASGRRVAAHFALEDRKTCYVLKTACHPAYVASGAGELLLVEAALDARARGLRELDFLGQAHESRRGWTRPARRHVRLEIYRPTARGRAAHTLRRLFH